MAYFYAEASGRPVDAGGSIRPAKVRFTLGSVLFPHGAVCVTHPDAHATLLFPRVSNTQASVAHAVMGVSRTFPIGTRMDLTPMCRTATVLCGNVHDVYTHPCAIDTWLAPSDGDALRTAGSVWVIHLEVPVAHTHLRLVPAQARVTPKDLRIRRAGVIVRYTDVRRSNTAARPTNTLVHVIGRNRSIGRTGVCAIRTKG